ncbi:MAG: metal ABC transporter permease [Pirellulales bacterium]|nr:metal ABC transporter permease [Pirellulales bacterium]
MNGLTWWFTESWQWWLFITAALTSVSCGMLGVVLVLRKLSLMGDAISHAVLPGLVLAFVLTGSIDPGMMLLGAFIVGLLTTWLIELLGRSGAIAADAGMGVVFTSLFAVGVVLIAVFTQGKVDLDIDCVLQGHLAHVATVTRNYFGWEIPAAVPALAATLVVNLLFLVIWRKELLVSAFDWEFAQAQGLRPAWVHYALMALTAMTTVASFEVVGSILVIAMLILPAATAQLLTNRWQWLLPLAVLLALLSAYLGIVLSLTPWLENAEPAALVAVTGGVIYALAVAFSPTEGLAFVWWRQAAERLRIMCEDLLAVLFRIAELAPAKTLGTRELASAIGGGWLAWLAIWSVRRRNQIIFAEGGWQLTTEGRGTAKRLVRSHRLWEAWLVRHLGLPLDHVHAPAERMEHFIDHELQAEIAAQIAPPPQAPLLDPHGKEIPE